MTIGYCCKCKSKREMVSTETTKLKTGVKALKGKCKKCGTKMFKIIGK